MVGRPDDAAIKARQAALIALLLDIGLIVLLGIALAVGAVLVASTFGILLTSLFY